MSCDTRSQNKADPILSGKLRQNYIILALKMCLCFSLLHILLFFGQHFELTNLPGPSLATNTQKNQFPGR